MNLLAYIDSVVELHSSIGIRALYKKDGNAEYNIVVGLVKEFVEKNFPTTITTRCYPGRLKDKQIYNNLTKYVQDNFPKVLNTT